MARSRRKEKAFPVGLFILLSLAILIGGIIWIRGLATRPVMSFTVAYRDPGSQVNEGIAVYYRGVQVGRVTKVELSRDKDSTLVHIGLSEEGLKVPVNAQVFIKLEGITGQRYVDIKPPKDNARVVTYVQDGDVIWGTNNLTWEKIQEQLNRIAENRTIEKLLTKSEKAVDDFRLASADLASFGRQGRQFFANSEASTQAALQQFTRTARNAEPALVSVRNAGDRIGATFDELRYQLTASNLIPNWSQTATDISAGVSGVRSDVQSGISSLTGDVSAVRADVQRGISSVSGDVSSVRSGIQSGVSRLTGGPVPEVQELNMLMLSLDEAGDTLEKNLSALRHSNQDGQLDPSLQQLETLAKTIQETAKNGQPSITAQSNPEQLRQQLALLGTIGDQISATSDQVAPKLIARLSQRDNRPVGPAENLLSTVETLDTIGKNLSASSRELQPKVNELIALQRQGRATGGGGIFGDLRAGIAQLKITAERFDCVAKQMSGILDERFLGFKLFFGQPGGGFHCQEIGGRR